MSKLKMMKFEAATLQNNSKNLIEELQKASVVEIESFSDKRLFETNTQDVGSRYEKSIDTVSDALSILAECGVKLGGGMFSGRTEISDENYREKSSKVSQTLDTAYDIIKVHRSISDYAAESVRLTTALDSLRIWQKLDVPLGTSCTESSVYFAGSFPREYTHETLAVELAAILGDVREYSFEIVYSSKEITAVFFVCHKSVEKAVTSALRTLSFIMPSEGVSGSIPEKIKELEEKLSQCAGLEDKARQQLKSYESSVSDLKFAYDYFTVKRDESLSLSDMKFSDSTIYLRGYVPEIMTEKMKKIVQDNDGAVIFYEPSEDDDVPVVMSNGKFSEPVESIVEMFAMPSKSDIDPSKIMAFFYYLLFGMMLSDAGYGLVLGLGSFLILRFTGVEGSMRKMLKMFVYCGISTVFWGALFGSWFGDAIPVIRREFFGVENPGGVALWFDPISDPIKLLLFSFGIGICHLFLGLFALGYMRWRDGDKISAFCDTVPIMLTVLGAAPLAAGVIVSVPTAVTGVAKYIAIAGVILIVLTSSRSGNIFARLFGGMYALYNTASGYLSDILSYSRLLALGLATGSIGSVVNMLAVMIDGPVIKEIVFIVVFIVGHTLNMAINVLGAYVHTNRLQFVELFSKFYEGGGRGFKPFRLNTKYFKLKEENKND